MTTTATINGSRRIEAWGSSSKNTKNKHRCKHICAVISLICGFALVILGILIVLFFRDLVDKIIKSVSQIFYSPQLFEANLKTAFFFFLLLLLSPPSDISWKSKNSCFFKFRKFLYGPNNCSKCLGVLGHDFVCFCSV